jgi:hypothetical protein
MQLGILRIGTGRYETLSRTVENNAGKSCIALAAGEVHRFEGRKGQQVRVQQGKVWLTVEGELRDFILEAGQEMTIPQRGGVVVQAMDGAAQLCMGRRQSSHN